MSIFTGFPEVLVRVVGTGERVAERVHAQVVGEVLLVSEVVQVAVQVLKRVGKGVGEVDLVLVVLERVAEREREEVKVVQHFLRALFRRWVFLVTQNLVPEVAYVFAVSVPANAYTLLNACRTCVSIGLH